MLRRVDALKEDHARLRELLARCEAASPEGLRTALVQLQDALGAHLVVKESLYEAAVLATRAAGDVTGLSLLSIFRTNLNVTSGAVLGFLRTPDPQPERLQQRLRVVIGALRSLLDTEEKVVFPLCARHAAALNAAGSVAAWPSPESGLRTGGTK